MSGTHKGYLLEFPSIRVDCFTQDIASVRIPSLGSNPPPAAQLYLLTHVHTDHLTGLSSSTFSGLILCSRATKAMLLRLQTEKSRRALEFGEIDRPRYKYANLWPRRGGAEETIGEKRKKRKRGRREGQWVDHVRTMEYDRPEEIRIGKETVTITMLDANHCPGSSMFLIQDANTAILHTGDVRADGPFIERLRVHPAVQPFVRQWGGIFGRKDEESEDEAHPRMERIYLDTGMFLGTGDVPSRSDAIAGLIATMRKYPAETHWFFECFTWGYEEVLKAVRREFGERVHVDRYKRIAYTLHRDLDPELAALHTEDEATRFHACELKLPCATCRQRMKNGSLFVRVSFPEVKLAEFDVRHGMVMREVEAAARGHGPWPTKLLCPAARHSPLPELQALVRLFRPRNLSPNALLYDLSLGTPSRAAVSVRGADYHAMVSLFGDCLGPGGQERLRAEAVEYGKRFGLDTPQQVEDNFRAVFGVPDAQDFSERDLSELNVNIDHISLEGYGRRGSVEPLAPIDEVKPPLQHTVGRDRRANRTLYAAAALDQTPSKQDSTMLPWLAPLPVDMSQAASSPESFATGNTPSPAPQSGLTSRPISSISPSTTPIASTQVSSRFRASPATMAILSRRRQERRTGSGSVAQA